MAQQLETMIMEAICKGGALSNEDIQMLVALGEAMENVDGLVPPEAVRLFKKAMKQVRVYKQEILSVSMEVVYGYFSKNLYKKAKICIFRNKNISSDNYGTVKFLQKLNFSVTVFRNFDSRKMGFFGHFYAIFDNLYRFIY